MSKYQGVTESVVIKAKIKHDVFFKVSPFKEQKDELIAILS